MAKLVRKRNLKSSYSGWETEKQGLLSDVIFPASRATSAWTAIYLDIPANTMY